MMKLPVDGGAASGLTANPALSPLRQGGCGSHTGAWYCVQSRPRMETIAAGELARQGFGSFLPLVAVRRRRPGKPEDWPTGPGGIISKGKRRPSMADAKITITYCNS